MLISNIVVTTAALLAVTQAAPPPEKAGEVRIFVTDREGAALGGAALADATVLVYLEPSGGKRQTLKPARKPAGTAELPSVVQWRETPKWRVGVAFVAASDPAPKTEYHAAPFLLESWACHMKDAPPQEKPGKCPKCGMEMELGPTELDAIVVLRIDGETKSLRGYHHPPEVPPTTFAEGVAQLAAIHAEFDRFAIAGKHDATHPLADKMTRVAAATVVAAGAPKDAKFAAAARTIGELAEALDQAEHYGTPEEVKAVLARYREVIAVLRATPAD